MARNVADLALLLSVISGPAARVPLALETPGTEFARPLQGEVTGVRVAMSTDLGGAFEVDRDVAAILEAQREVFAAAGAVVADAAPDLSGAEDTFRTLRAWHFQSTFGELLAAHPDKFKSSLAANIRVGESLTGADIARAYVQRTSLSERMRIFFDDYDVLVLPVSQVPPFSADEEYPREINGRAQETYLDWMRSAYFITVTGCPAISLPAGFTAEGWPIGIQIVAAPNQEHRLLDIAYAFEQRTHIGDRRPTL